MVLVLRDVPHDSVDSTDLVVPKGDIDGISVPDFLLNFVVFASNGNNLLVHVEYRILTLIVPKVLKVGVEQNSHGL